MEQISVESMKRIALRLLKKAQEATAEFRSKPGDEYLSGRSEACYELMDILQSELEVEGIELKQVGLDVDLVKELV